MAEAEHPDYPVEGGRPALTEEELRTDEHRSVSAESPDDAALREVFRHDAVEILDPGTIHDYPTPAHAAEALGLRGHYGEEDAETIVRCLTARQARLEERGFAAITEGPNSRRTKQAMARISLGDEEVLARYLSAGTPALNDERQLRDLARDLDMERTDTYRLRLRRSVRRLASTLESRSAYRLRSAGPVRQPGSGT